MGSLIANAVQLENPQKVSGIYFVFPDLSVRSEGKYTLKFMFFDLAVGEPLTMSTKVQAEVYTQSFTVYSAKKFPGMTESTELSKCFARQGIKIPIRKESRFKRPTDRFYGANALDSMIAGPSRKGTSESVKIDKSIASPDDENDPAPSTLDKEQEDGDREGLDQPLQKDQEETTPTAHKRLSISSYLTSQRD